VFINHNQPAIIISQLEDKAGKPVFSFGGGAGGKKPLAAGRMRENHLAEPVASRTIGGLK